MGARNFLFCAYGMRESPCTGTGIHWPKRNRKWEWDEDLSKTATRTMGFGQWELLNIWLENWNRPPRLQNPV